MFKNIEKNDVIELGLSKPDFYEQIPYLDEKTIMSFITVMYSTFHAGIYFIYSFLSIINILIIIININITYKKILQVNKKD